MALVICDPIHPERRLDASCSDRFAASHDSKCLAAGASSGSPVSRGSITATCRAMRTPPAHRRCYAERDDDQPDCDPFSYEDRAACRSVANQEFIHSAASCGGFSGGSEAHLLSRSPWVELGCNSVYPRRAEVDSFRVGVALPLYIILET